jgi:hypothetical protein
MIHDPILAELRSIREAIAQEHNYDVNSLFAMFRQSAAASSHVHVNLSKSTSIGVLVAPQLGVATDETWPRR